MQPSLGELKAEKEMRKTAEADASESDFEAENPPARIEGGKTQTCPSDRD